MMGLMCVGRDISPWRDKASWVYKDIALRKSTCIPSSFNAKPV